MRRESRGPSRRDVDRWDRLGASLLAAGGRVELWLGRIVPAALIGGSLLVAAWLSLPMWGPARGESGPGLDW